MVSDLAFAGGIIPLPIVDVKESGRLIFESKKAVRNRFENLPFACMMLVAE
jgi:hypothetical protein